ncbi:MAG: hypothetical protein RI897_4379 [Verrucomicrobiota bacterium]
MFATMQTSGVHSDTPRRQCVLLVDDEEDSRDATSMVLEHMGYDVDVAIDAEDALLQFRPERHDLVITDNRMPGRSGVELSRELRQIAPQIPIIMYTGLAPEPPPPVSCLLEKPFQVSHLQAAVRQFLPPPPTNP